MFKQQEEEETKEEEQQKEVLNLSPEELKEYKRRKREYVMNYLIIMCNDAYNRANKDALPKYDQSENYDPIKRLPDEPKYDGLNSFRKIKRTYYIDGFIKSTTKLI
jgi:hypothetical protein